jgi:hypothetical protein
VEGVERVLCIHALCVVPAKGEYLTPGVIVFRLVYRLGLTCRQSVYFISIEVRV